MFSCREKCGEPSCRPVFWCRICSGANSIPGSGAPGVYSSGSNSFQTGGSGNSISLAPAPAPSPVPVYVEQPGATPVYVAQPSFTSNAIVSAPGPVFNQQSSYNSGGFSPQQSSYDSSSIRVPKSIPLVDLNPRANALQQASDKAKEEELNSIDYLNGPGTPVTLETIDKPIRFPFKNPLLRKTTTPPPPVVISLTNSQDPEEQDSNYLDDNETLSSEQALDEVLLASPELLELSELSAPAWQIWAQFRRDEKKWK